MIKLIVFDLWQTLAYRKGDFNHFYTRQILKKFNLKFSIEEAVKIFENSVQLKKWVSKFEAYKNLCKNFGIDETCENINLLVGMRNHVENNAVLYKHSLPLLKNLKKQGYEIGLITNSTVFSIEKIKKMGLLKYIDYPVFSFDVGVVKPDLKSFKLILKKANVKPNEAVMIGDKIKDDVIPPRKIGMNSIHFQGIWKLKKELEEFGVNL